jgi:hypothetical protein
MTITAISDRSGRPANPDRQERTGSEKKCSGPRSSGSLVAVGQPAAEITQLVDEKGIDLVVAATRGGSPAEAADLGSVTQRLTAPGRPLPRSKASRAHRPGAAGIRLKNLIGCDFSESSVLA